jgi:autotransporter-associated beta strand protein
MKPKIRIQKPHAAVFAALAALVATSIPVRAATLTWDHDANGTASDGAGTWLNANQWVDSVPTPATWNNTTPDNAIIGSGGAGGTITLGTVTAGTVLINNFTGTYTLSGGSLDQSGGITIGTTAGNLTISTPVSGTGALAKSGAGTLTLSSNSNTFSGGITVNAGRLVASADSNLGATSGGLTFNGTCSFGNDGTWTIDAGRTTTISDGANVTFNSAGLRFNGPVVGSGTLTVAKPSQGNPGLYLASTANTFTGAMNLGDKGADDYAFYDFNSLGDGPGAGKINLGYGGQGAVFRLTSVAIAPLVLNHRQFDIGGDASFIVNDASSANTITINTDLLFTGAGSRTLVLAGNNTGDNTIAGKIPDGPTGTVISLSKSGIGKWILSGANTYTGGTTVSGGTLTINGSLADASMNISGASSTVNGSGTLTFNINGTTTDVIAMSAGTLNVSGLTVNVNPAGSGLTETQYVLVNATGGTIVGTFAGLTGAPGYALNYDTPNQVKLVQSGGGDPFATWATAAGLDGTPGKENGKADDPDGDGRNNLYEFAFNGDPLDGSDNGLIAGLVQDASAPAGSELTLVVAVRDGATFTGSGTPVVQSNTTLVDGLTYTIQGTLDLATIPGSDVSHMGGPSDTAPVATGLPDLTGTDWEYHTFKLDASEGLGSKGFLRAKVE